MVIYSNFKKLHITAHFSVEITLFKFERNQLALSQMAQRFKLSFHLIKQNTKTTRYT